MAHDEATIAPNTNNSIARIRAALIMAEKILQSFESSCIEVDSLYSDRTGKAIMQGRDSKTSTQFEIEISTKQNIDVERKY